MTQEERLQKAIELFREAYRRQMEGDLEGAIERYQRSIALQPTAEAHTFLGWTYSFQGRLEEAIAECKEAIAVDPDFGNPRADLLGEGAPCQGAGGVRVCTRARPRLRVRTGGAGRDREAAELAQHQVDAAHARAREGRACGNRLHPRALALPRSGDINLSPAK